MKFTKNVFLTRIYKKVIAHICMNIYMDKQIKTQEYLKISRFGVGFI